MQSLSNRSEQSNISLGERRGKSDLARFSLDLSWARAVSHGARSRAYPSPPMSGSPPLPPRRNPESSDRDHGSYGPGQDVFRSTLTPQLEPSRRVGAPLRPYQPELQHTAYPHAQMDDPAARYQYQQAPQQMPPQPQYYAAHPPPQPAQQYSVAARQPILEASDHNSPKAQRKTKGHVASACVPCKRAHLRCDAQRPCSRCLSNGKEDTCIDVQHKKRGRPRLRDERDPRYENVGPGFQTPPEGLRRPLSLYGPGDGPSMSSQFGETLLQRSGSYRVLKSQGGGGSVPPRYPEHAEAIYAAALPPQPAAGPRIMPPQESMCAYLTMDLQIAKATQAFNDAIGVQSSAARKLHDIVGPNDRDKVFRLQRIFEDERREREPNYLPPIYLKYEEDRVIQSVGFGPEEMSQFQANRPEMFTFQGPDGQQRTFHVRFGLAKKDSTYFIVFVLHIPATPQTYHQPSSSPYSRESYSRDSQYGYQTPQQAFAQAPNVSPYGQNPPFGDPRGEHLGYRPAPAAGVIVPPMPPASHPYAQSQARPEFAPTQHPYQTPRSELPPQGQAPPQHGLQLPPIRDQRVDASQSDPRRRDDRSGRVDIGGLLEKPDASRR
ncbi:hypothetical protein BP6252_08581 [Coleophoma cylindrospora]|uniref:Zn(2)-C6 fungal-type domain-containing protein n=1 Tax=Coleophoma cylindrospora TaxID=1849047 RepID=A0A3D8R6J1_9HELO|nr:hypothetical protein BP6252_08581 [Coleophoma cylindrospora]